MTYRGHQEPGDLPTLERNPMYLGGNTEARVTPLLKNERNGRREALEAVQAGQSALYAAWVPGGLVKIGCTAHLYSRMSQIKGDLIGFRFGDYAEERDIHRSLAEHVAHGREWYYPTPAVIAVANEFRESLGLEPIAA